MLAGAHDQVHVVQNHPLPASHIHLPQLKKIALLRNLCRCRFVLCHPAPIHLLD